LCQGHSTLVYAGAGIVEGTNPSFEWDELDLKASQVSLSNVMNIIADIYLNANRTDFANIFSLPSCCNIKNNIAITKRQETWGH
jgi:hypothetical protein